MSSFYRFLLFIFIIAFTGSGDLVVIASDGSEIQATIDDFGPFNEHFTPNKCYLLPLTLIKLSVFVVCGPFNFQYIAAGFHMPIWDRTIDKKCLRS